MNYYNPYFYNIPSMAGNVGKVGLFSRLFGSSGITLGGILNGTQKALNFANQAIPFVKQVKPMIGNAKTMFKVMNEFKKTERGKTTTVNTSTNSNLNTNTNTNSYVNRSSNNESNEITSQNYQKEYEDGPTFFM